MSIAVRFEDVVKGFGPVRVLHGVSFELRAGPRLRPARRERRRQVHADEDPRRLRAADRRRACASTASRGASTSSRDAEAAGIVLIHQEFNLAEDLTIAQNIFLGHEKKRGWLLDDAAMRAGRGARAARRSG